MSRCINQLPRILEERELSSEVLALESQIPQIQKVSWTNDNVSPKWLKRMSSVYTFNPGINGSISNVALIRRPKRILQHWNINKYHQLTSPNDVLTHSAFEVFSECDESSGSKESFTANLSAGDESSTPRKPDSTYITLISGITNAASPSSSCLNKDQ